MTGEREHVSADALGAAGYKWQKGGASRWSRTGATSKRPAPRPPRRSSFVRCTKGACRFFDGVLGPGYDAAHADHLHFDRGPFRLCL